MNVLLNWDLEGFEVRNFPATPARIDQKLQRMSADEAWWFERISQSPTLIGTQRLEDRENRIDRQRVLGDLNEYGRINRRNFHPYNSTKLGIALRKLVPSIEDYRPSPREPRMWVLPSISELRRHFERKFRIKVSH